MRILITGGSGFIGTYLSRELLAMGHTILNLDIVPPAQDLQQYWEFRDITIKDSLYYPFKKFKPEVVYHLAAQTSVPKSVADPEYDARVNITGTLNVKHACKRRDVRKLIFASTAAAYGAPQYLPLDEDHILDPASPYGISKMTGEAYIRATMGYPGAPTYTILRFANVYGCGGGGVIPLFLTNLLNNIPLHIFSTGEQTRDYLYVDDLVGALIKCLTKGDGETINISTESQTNLWDLTELMGKVTGFDYQTLLFPPRAGDIEDSFMTNRKAEEILGWTPTTSLEEGLAEMVKEMSLAERK